MPPRALFIHVPKTGGPVVNKFMASRYPAEKYAEYIDARPDWDGLFTDHDYVAGHIRIGQVLPYIERGQWYMFSVVRKPLEQIFSHLAWTKTMSSPESYCRHVYHSPHVRQKFYDFENITVNDPDSLSAFINSKAEYRTFFDNYQTRYFLNSYHDAPLTYFEFKIALNNLRKLDLVGINDRMPEFLTALAGDLGVDPPEAMPDPKVNWWREKFDIDEKDGLLRGALAEFTKYDDILYEEAQNLFSARSGK